VVSGLIGLLATAVLAVPPLPTGTDVDHQLGGAATSPEGVHQWC
jgi:hypothetical protein